MKNNISNSRSPLQVLYHYLIKNKVMLALTFVLISGLLLLSMILPRSAGRIAYVDTLKLYESFDMKRELQGKLQQKQELLNGRLDSLKVKLEDFYTRQGEVTDSKIKNELRNQIAFLEREYKDRYDEYAKENLSMTDRYNNQIWERINQLVAQYGEEKKYEYILGANGTGTIMFAAQSEEITDVVLIYMNEKYRNDDAK